MLGFAGWARFKIKSSKEALVSFKERLVSLGGDTFYQFYIYFLILNLFLKYSGDSGGAVGLGMFFYVG